MATTARVTPTAIGRVTTMSQVLVTIRGESGTTERFQIDYIPTLQLAYNIAETTAGAAPAGVSGLAVASLPMARRAPRLTPHAAEVRPVAAGRCSAGQ